MNIQKYKPKPQNKFSASNYFLCALCVLGGLSFKEDLTSKCESV